MEEKKIIKNKFFDIITVFISLIFGFFRGVFLLFSSKNLKHKNYFFDILDFLFRIWPKYFWERPTLYKITNFLSDFINYVFYDIQLKK
jgi:hypothetical protein